MTPEQIKSSMDTDKKVIIFPSKLNEPSRPRKAEEIFKWLYTPLYGWEKPGQ